MKSTLDKIPALIIARGGSKRLPRKNVLPFCELPLVAWTIIQANCSHHIDEVYLSTDDEEIAEIGKKHGAVIIWRDGIAVGDIPAGPVIQHMTEHLLQYKEFERACVLIPTSPCKLPGDIDRAIVEHLKIDTGMGRVAAFYFPRETEVHERAYWRTDRNIIYPTLFNKHGRYTQGTAILTVDFVEEILTRRKRFDIEDIYMETIGRTGPTSVSGYVEIEWFQQYDIDYQDDFELCEILMERYILRGRGAEIYFEYEEEK